jgi:hypothetical protein
MVQVWLFAWFVLVTAGLIFFQIIYLKINSLGRRGARIENGILSK